MGAYKSIIRPLLFKTDPERIHDFSIAMGEKLGRFQSINQLLNKRYSINDHRLKLQVSGINFDNPIGLAAGYDKSGNAIPFLESLGFSHIEIGSVSAQSSDGNPRPRLFRLPIDKAIIVHYGLQNEGAKSVSERLKGLQLKKPLGINIVKTNRGINAAPDSGEDILSDYRLSIETLKSCGDYLTFNMSCPNTEMGRDFFADKTNIQQFMEMLSELKPDLPVFLKISPVGGIETIEKYLEAVDHYSFISGFIFNLPPGKTVELITERKVWENMPGAVSGKPVESYLNFCISEMYKRMDNNRFSIIGAGGVFNAEDAYLKIKLGASLVQLLTGMIFQGPGIIKNINKGLIQCIERDGLDNISQAIGTAHNH